MTKSKKKWKKLAKKYEKEVLELRRRVDRLERYIGPSYDVPQWIEPNQLYPKVRYEVNCVSDRIL